MEKRFVLFLLSTFLVLAIYVGAKLVLAPPPVAEPGDQQVGAAGDLPPGEDALPDDKPDGDPQKSGPASGGDTPGGNTPATETPGNPNPDKPGSDPDKPGADKPGADEPVGGAAGDGAAGDGASRTAIGAAEPEVVEERVTLGSMDPNSGFLALVTLNTRGAALERFELTGRNKSGRLRYRHLEHVHGYLGHLGLTDMESGAGCRVNVVGPGTPAATALPLAGTGPAGLRVGDIIKRVDGVQVRNGTEFARIIDGTRPDQSLELQVVRGEDTLAETLEFSVQLTEQPMEVIQPEYDRQMPFAAHRDSLLLSLSSVGDQEWREISEEPPGIAAMRNGVWTLVPGADDQVVEFRKELAGEQLTGTGLTGRWGFVKRYRLSPVPTEARLDPDYPGYHLDVEIEIHNRGSEPQEVAYRLQGPGSLPLEGWWFSNKIHPQMFKGAGARDVVWRPDGFRNQQMKGCSDIQRQAVKDPESPGIPLLNVQDPSPLDYIGVDAQYFSSVMIPTLGSGSPEDPPLLRFASAEAIALGNAAEKPKKEIRATNTSFVVTSFLERIEPDQPLKHQFTLFAGPKRPALLESYRLGSLIEYGWFAMVAVPLSVVLHSFYYVVGNYGIAIIMLTVLVRGCMFPISRKAARNAQKMQELAPELKKLADKYKNDMEKRGQAQKELFAKHNYNPAGGCLLMFLQLPVFIGLYRCLSVDIELRQAPLIPGIEWCSNLAGPDKLFRWDGILPDWLAGETGWLGPYLNILPIFTILLFIVQQKLFTPPATDEQSRMQQQVMKFMMVFMGVLFFKVPAGLCLYFISSSLWGISERLLLPKSPPPGTAGVTAKATAAAPRGSGSNGDPRKAQALARKKQRKR